MEYEYVVSLDEEVIVLAFAEEEEGSETGEEEAPPNPVLPEPNHIIWALVSFLVLWALMQFVLLPPLLKSREERQQKISADREACLLYTSPSPRDQRGSRMPSSA